MKEFKTIYMVGNTTRRGLILRSVKLFDNIEDVAKHIMVLAMNEHRKNNDRTLKNIIMKYSFTWGAVYKFNTNCVGALRYQQSYRKVPKDELLKLIKEAGIDPEDISPWRIGARDISFEIGNKVITPG